MKPSLGNSFLHLSYGLDLTGSRKIIPAHLAAPEHLAWSGTILSLWSTWNPCVKHISHCLKHGVFNKSSYLLLSIVLKVGKLWYKAKCDPLPVTVNSFIGTQPGPLIYVVLSVYVRVLHRNRTNSMQYLSIYLPVYLSIYLSTITIQNIFTTMPKLAYD